jgi:hypothetical protein
MRISAKVDYAVRAAVELAAGGDQPVKGEVIAESQDIPLKFLENILGELKHVGIVASRRGAQGGYWLAKPAAGVLATSSGQGGRCKRRGQGPGAWNGAPGKALNGLDRGAEKVAPCRDPRSEPSGRVACGGRPRERGSLRRVNPLSGERPGGGRRPHRQMEHPRLRPNEDDLAPGQLARPARVSWKRTSPSERWAHSDR